MLQCGEVEANTRKCKKNSRSGRGRVLQSFPLMRQNGGDSADRGSIQLHHSLIHI